MIKVEIRPIPEPPPQEVVITMLMEDAVLLKTIIGRLGTKNLEIIFDRNSISNLHGFVNRLYNKLTYIK